MKRIKGVVLESTAKHLILLTGEGEYRRLSARGRLYPLGAEVEIAPALLPANLPVIAAAAALLLVLSFTLLWQPVMARPAAYLALDINPSILLFLDKDAAVIKAEISNRGGQAFGNTLELEGISAVSALEMILQEAVLQGYLAGTKENVVFLALAAPPDYGLNEDVLHQFASRQLFFLEIDSYLKINTTSPETARDARQKDVSLNAVMLAEDLAARGLLSLEDEVEQEEKLENGSAEVSVRKLLEQVPLQHVFSEKELIRGESSERQDKDTGPPGGLPKQAEEQGRPDHIPPGQEKDKGKPEQIPPGQAKKPQESEVDKPVGDKDTGPPGGLPKQAEKQGKPDHIPPGQSKDQGKPEHTPPGQAKKP